MIFDTRPCELGEGPLWHPERRQLYWFDITRRRLLTREGDAPRQFDFPEMVSAIGWAGGDAAVVAAESGLLRVSLTDGSFRPLAQVQAGAGTRSNDGRADRQGGFWWSTMGKRGGEDAGKGAIWRYYRGEVRRLVGDLSIPNAICFSADGRLAHYADTVQHKVWRLRLDAEGWPEGAAEVFLDLAEEGLNPDGATICAEGLFWNAQWGAGRVAAYTPEGAFARAVHVAAPHASCPAFGGEGLATLYVTTAQEGMEAAALAAHPHAGRVFAVPGVGRGLPEPRVVLQD